MGCWLLNKTFWWFVKTKFEISSKFPYSTTFILNSSKTKFVGNYDVIATLMLSSKCKKFKLGATLIGTVCSWEEL